MQEQLISFETAKLAKEKRFDEECYYTYGRIGKEYCIFKSEYSETNSEINKYIYSAPTQSLLQKWLRDAHHIDVLSFHKYRLKGTTWTSEVYFKGDLIYTNHDYENDYTYEEALEIGLQEGLKLIELCKNS